MSIHFSAFDFARSAKDFRVGAARLHAAAIDLEADLRAEWNAASIYHRASQLLEVAVLGIEILGPAANTPTAKHLREAMVVLTAVKEAAAAVATETEELVPLLNVIHDDPVQSVPETTPVPPPAAVATAAAVVTLQEGV